MQTVAATTTDLPQSCRRRRWGGGRGGKRRSSIIMIRIHLPRRREITDAPDTPNPALVCLGGSHGATPFQGSDDDRVLNDQSGPYRDDGGPTSVICAQQAVLDFGVSGKGFNFEVLSADHQNKPDVGASIARQWIDQQGVDVIADVPTSSVGLAVKTVCRERNKIMLNSGTGTSDLTGRQCSPNTIHWTYDTYTLGKSTGQSIVKGGDDTWFFVTADYAFGQARERDTRPPNSSKPIVSLQHRYATSSVCMAA